MTARDDFDRHLSAWLAAEAPPSEPGHLLGEVLARTARTRRRAAWRIPERWIPMSTITTRAATGWRVPIRPLAFVTLLVIALVVGAVLIAGAQRRTLPPPFGLAANGQLSFSIDGDIMALDSLDGTPRTIIAGPQQDWGAIYSATGDRLVFVRGVDGDRNLWVANADGSDQQQLFGPMPTIPGWVEWSPQADVIALTLDDDPSRIRMIRADGSGISVIETGLKTAFSPIFRPPDGRQLTFRGEAPDGTMGIYVIGRDGSDLRRLELDPGFETDPAYAVDAPYYFNAPQWSADGQTMLYHQLEPDPASPEGAGFRIHQATVEPAGEVTDERILEFDRAMDDEMEPTYLPSGDGFTYQTIDNGIYKLWVVSTAPGSRPRQIGAQTSSWQGRLTSPDGTTLITYFGGVDTGSGWTMRRIDLATGRVTPMTIGDDLSWQRLALPR